MADTDRRPGPAEGSVVVRPIDSAFDRQYRRFRTAGELKHGVLALVERRTPCIALVQDALHNNRVVVAADEVRARQGFVVGLAPNDSESFDYPLPVPAGRFPYFFGALATLQLLSYEPALKKGFDPDKPRNLAKSVTVR